MGFTRQPLAWIGAIVAIVVLILQQAIDSGIVTADATKNLFHFLILVLIGAFTIVGRQLVTPAAAPRLKIGTPVTTPDGDPAVVNGAAPSTRT